MWEEKKRCGNKFKLVSVKHYKGLGGFRADVSFGDGTQRKGEVLLSQSKRKKESKLEVAN